MMKVNLDVDLHHIARVEGHGNIKVRVREGTLEEANWEVVETPRFFEVMLKGKLYSAAPLLSSRICGICSIAHCLTSLEATEDAFGIEIPERAAQLRLLAKHGETLQSHVLHMFFLAAPDFLRLPSVIPLIATQPELVDLAKRLKSLANRLCDLVAGRTTHPVAFCVGGVSMVPSRDNMLAIHDELVRSLEDLKTVAEVFSSFEIPDFIRETEFVSVRGIDEYAFIGREMKSTDGVVRPASEYLEMTNEFVVAKGTSKWCKLSRESFAVGPLARFNNNHQLLHADASAVASDLGLKPVCHNPFMNNVARVVECVHATLEAIRLIEELTGTNDDAESRVAVAPRAGVGVGVVEAPRGILYHCYEYDAEGRIVRADCVIPTTQNHANIQHDLDNLVPQFVTETMSDEDLELLCSMLVRSYDPCISCSVH
jgi:coenzyme F420-reducing hydrogenase alpha subunit